MRLFFFRLPAIRVGALYIRIEPTQYIECVLIQSWPLGAVRMKTNIGVFGTRRMALSRHVGAGAIRTRSYTVKPSGDIHIRERKFSNNFEKKKKESKRGEGKREGG